MGRKLGVDGDGAVDFTALAHEAAERELDVRLLRFRRESREHFRGAIEAVVDQVIQAGEVIDFAPQTAAARRSAAERKRRRPEMRKQSRRTSGPMPRKRMLFPGAHAPLLTPPKRRRPD